MPKKVHFGEFLKTRRLRSSSVTRQVRFNRSKIGAKCQNSKIATFWVIFKQCATTRLKTEDQGHLPSGESSCQRCYENWDVHQNLMDECKRALLADRVTFWVTFVAWLILTFWWNEPHEPLLNLMNLMDLLNLFWTS